MVTFKIDQDAFSNVTTQTAPNAFADITPLAQPTQEQLIGPSPMAVTERPVTLPIAPAQAPQVQTDSTFLKTVATIGDFVVGRHLTRLLLNTQGGPLLQSIGTQ